MKIGEKVKSIYASFCQGDIVVTDIKTAEMTKVVENTYRAVNIAFANELARICRHDGMDVYEVIKICNMHPRVNILQPGPGVGGHCIPIDPWFLVGEYPELTNVISASMHVNEDMPKFVIERAEQIMKENGISDWDRVGLYGLTYKENVDDVRESPSLQLFEIMKQRNVNIKCYDPYVVKDIVVEQYHDFDKFLADVDMVIVMVGHDEIKENAERLKDKKVLDTRKIVSAESVYKI